MHIRNVFYSLFLVFTSIQCHAQTEQPNYKVATAKFKKFYNSNQPDSIYAMFSPKGKAALSAEKFKTVTTQLRSQLGNLNQIAFVKYTDPQATYKADFANLTLAIKLSVDANNQLGTFYTDQYVPETTASQMDPSLTETPMTEKTLGGTISGTLTMPKSAGAKIPVVLIIAGSGPTDRNGNTPSLNIMGNTYLKIAEALGKAGIASVRYDKRGIGQSASSAKEADTRFSDFVDDASQLISTLKDDQRFSKVIVLGHSEGSLVGILASTENVNAFISAAGAGEPGDKIVTEQLKSQPGFMGAGFKTILDSLRKGKTVPNVDPGLYTIARPSIQPYLMSWFRYNPQKEIKKLKIPILIVQGTTDIQVTVADAEKLKKAKPEATLKIIEGMNHVLKQAPADREQNIATYKNPELPLKPEFITAVTDFIKGLK